MAAIVAVLAVVPPRVAAAEGGDLRYDAFATVSPFAAFLMGSDYGLDAEGIVEIGAGGSVSRRFGRFFDLGLGLHYDYGRDSEYGDYAHLVAEPMLATLVIPIGAASELRAGIGLGPAYGIAGDKGRRAHALGGSVEIALAFAQRIRPDGLGLCVQLGIRGDLARPVNTEPEDDLDSALVNIQFPFIRAGVSWR